jgi:hypothetical protein
MSPPDRDDAPPDFSLFRRKTLIGGGLLLGGFAAAPRIPAAPEAPATADFDNQFLQLSSLLIPHQLDRDVGLRLAAALRTKDPAFTAHVTALLEIARKKTRKSSRSSSRMSRMERSKTPHCSSFRPGTSA